MPYLTVGGTTVPVMTTAPRQRIEAVGDVRRAFSGVPRSSVRAYYRVWEGVETRWLSTAQAATVLSALTAAPPLTVAGDMVGATRSCIAVNIQRIETARAMLGGVNAEIVRLAFDLMETTP